MTTPELIRRREAIKRVSALLGGVTLIGGSALFQGCTTERAPDGSVGALFSAGDVALLDEIAETILPATSTPGAKAAGVGAFMALMVTDTYKPEDQVIFRTGLKALDEASRAGAGGTSFMESGAEARLAVLNTLDREQHDYQESKAKDAPNHYFRMMKELVLLGYFTSEVGMTQALRYVESPGRFDPCAPWSAGDRIWANHA